jgi:hypothetical protein
MEPEDKTVWKTFGPNQYMRGVIMQAVKEQRGESMFFSTMLLIGGIGLGLTLGFFICADNRGPVYERGHTAGYAEGRASCAEEPAGGEF